MLLKLDSHVLSRLPFRLRNMADSVSPSRRIWPLRWKEQHLASNLPRCCMKEPDPGRQGSNLFQLNACQPSQLHTPEHLHGTGGTLLELERTPCQEKNEKNTQTSTLSWWMLERPADSTRCSSVKHVPFGSQLRAAAPLLNRSKGASSM